MADDIQQEALSQPGQQPGDGQPNLANALQPNSVQPEITDEVRQMMEISLNGGIIPQQPDSSDPLPPQSGSEEPPNEPVNTQQPAAPDAFAPFKEKFGYQSVEDALKEIEELRGLREKPPVVDVEFENEQSEKLFKALREGKMNEVYQVLEQQQKLERLTTSEVNKDNADEIIKLGMQIKYKDLTPQEIDYKFRKQYAIPKEPIRDESLETEEDFAQRKAEWAEKVADIEMSKIIDAKLSKPDLESAKSKITLPEIEDQVDEGYLQYLKQLEDAPKIQEEVSAAYNALTPKNIETKLKFVDEPNNIDFEFQYQPDEESFSTARQMVLDISQFFESFKNSDGTPNREKFLDSIYFALNKEKVLLEAIKQAKNATIKSFLPDNSTPGNRQFPQTQELSELDKFMKMSLEPYQKVR